MASLIMELGDFEVSEDAALQMLGLQTDPYGTVYGGHGAILDFAAVSAVLNTLGVDGEVANVVEGGDPAICTGAFGAGWTAAKGALFTSATTGEKIALPDAFDLRTYGSGASVVLSIWAKTLTQFGASNIDSIAGYAHQITTENQWVLAGRDSSGYRGRFQVAGAVHEYGLPTVAAPTLYTAVMRPTGSTTCQVDFYKDDAWAATVAGTLPLNAPNPASHDLTPIAGLVGGFTGAWNGTLHRMQVFQIDPFDFDAAAWVAAEYAGNAARFAG